MTKDNEKRRLQHPMNHSSVKIPRSVNQRNLSIEPCTRVKGVYIFSSKQEYCSPISNFLTRVPRAPSTRHHPRSAQAFIECFRTPLGSRKGSAPASLSSFVSIPVEQLVTRSVVDLFSLPSFLFFPFRLFFPLFPHFPPVDAEYRRHLTDGYY